MNQQPLCVDDFGEAVYLCRYTKALTWASKSIWVGGPMPNVNSKYVSANTDEARALEKLHAKWFHESEGNCNTCKHLIRVPTPKSPYGILHGLCGRPIEVEKRARMRAMLPMDHVMRFHPHDPLHMPCYEGRP